MNSAGHGQGTDWYHPEIETVEIRVIETRLVSPEPSPVVEGPRVLHVRQHNSEDYRVLLPADADEVDLRQQMGRLLDQPTNGLALPRAWRAEGRSGRVVLVGTEVEGFAILASADSSQHES